MILAVVAMIVIFGAPLCTMLAIAVGLLREPRPVWAARAESH
jgi:hypothetical protein